MFSDFSIKSSSYISIDPVISIQRVDLYRTSSQHWTNDSEKSSYGNSDANPRRYDSSFTTISDNYHDHSNNTFPSKQPYHEKLDYPQYCLDNNTKHYSYLSMPDVERNDESIKENASYWHELDKKDYPDILGPHNLNERRPFQDLTNRPTAYTFPAQNDFKSQANKIESSYRGEEDKLFIERPLRREDIKVNEVSSTVPEQFSIKEEDMTYYSRPVVYNIEPGQNKRTLYSSEAYQAPSQIENWCTSNELNVNTIFFGKKKGKSVALTKRNRPKLDIDTSYNSNAHVLIIPADDGIEFKNLMHDSYTTRASFLEVKRW